MADWTAEINVYNFTGKSITLNSDGYRCSYGINDAQILPSTPESPAGTALNFHDKVNFSCEVEYSLWSILLNKKEIAELVDTSGGKLHIDLIPDEKIGYHLKQTRVDSSHFKLCINNIHTDGESYPLC